MIRVGYFQFRPLFGMPERNCDRVLAALRSARADLIVLPELPFTGYYFSGRREAEALAEDPRRSPIVERLVDLCRRRDMHLVTGFAERARGRVYNSSLLLGPHGLLRTYRKIQLFNMEKGWFDPGNRPPEVATVQGIRVGMMICFDWIFPEVARSLALKGADLIAHPSNLVLQYCQQAMFARCIENGVFAVTANRCGSDRRPHGQVRFTGRSQITGPRGETLGRAPASREELRIVRIDPRRARDKRMTPTNHLLRDRRPELSGR
jgi:predicted amidohydrolase